MKRVLDWSNYQDQGMGDAYADIPKTGGDYAKAISVCIRSGICQEANNKGSQSRGVMCPSFRISNNKDLSPGGRVALLKSVLNDEPENFLSNPQLAQTLDSCVSCKGCKRECENNLDMAAIKAEYLAQKHQLAKKGSLRQSIRLCLRKELFAEFPYLLYRYPVLAKLIGWRNRSRLLATIGRSLFGINSDIVLPEPSRLPYSDSPEQIDINQQHKEYTDSKSTLVLLIDAFTAQFNPKVADDALAVLNAAGYKVITLYPQSLSTSLASSSHTKQTSVLDSGRSLFSQGYMERARQQATDLIEQLKPHIAVNRRVVGLEPSALLMLRDEFLMMHLGDDAVALAKNTLLFEEFIARESSTERCKLNFAQQGDSFNVLVHGHCHQKAVSAMKSMRKVLKLIPNIEFQFIEASCCGMAGSYGLEAEHAANSVAMAEQGLLPELDANPNALVVCNGFSCSHQIYALRKRKPIHIATLLAKFLV